MKYNKGDIIKILGKNLFLLLIFIFLFQACKKEDSGSTGLTNDSLIKHLDSKLDSMYSRVRVPGIYLGIRATDIDLTYEKTKGYSDVSTYRNLNTTDIFRIGRVTNSFTSTVLLQLVDENKVSLDSMLSKYVSSVPNSQNISIRQLLNMTSGLYDYATDSLFLIQLKATPLKKWTPQELINYAITNPPYFPPGTGWHYSSTNSILIGMIVEQVTSSTLKQEIQNRIITPLNLQNTSFPTDQNMPTGSICNGYSLTSGPATFDNVTTRFDPSWIWADGAMISNSTDLKIWAKALVNGSLLSSTMQEERLKFIYSGTPSVKYGLGVYDFQNGFIGHKGSVPGYNNLVVYFPNRGALITIMINLYQVDNTSYGYPNLDSFFNSVIKLIYPDMKLTEDIFIVN
jgi:D-alanyl-D-alanine carboxypeptidase